MGGQQGPQVLFKPLILYMAAPSQPVGPRLVKACSCCSGCQSGCTITDTGARAWGTHAAAIHVVDQAAPSQPVGPELGESMRVHVMHMQCQVAQRSFKGALRHRLQLPCLAACRRMHLQVVKDARSLLEARDRALTWFQALASAYPRTAPAPRSGRSSPLSDSRASA